MAVVVNQSGATVTVTANPRGISDVNVVSGELIISYTNGTMESAGFVGSSDAFPTGAIVSRVDGSLLAGRENGEQLVGRAA